MRYKTGDRIRINHKGKRIWVKVIVAVSGRDLVAVDRAGQIYTTWWETNADLTGDKPPIKLRHWRCYSKGLYYLKRSLLYALVGAEQTRIPTLAQLQEFCQNCQAEIALLEGNMATQLGQMVPRFTQLAEFLAGKQRWTLVESKQQLSFFLLLRDSLGRLNIGVLQARLTAINWRFTNELEHLVGWLPHYAARFSAICNLQQQIQRQINQVARTLGAMTAHEAFKKGKTSAKQTKALEQVLGRPSLVLVKLREVQPFTKWVKFCLADLWRATHFIISQEFDQAKKLLDKVNEAMKLRILAFELEKVICQLGLDLILGQVDSTAYWGKILDLCSRAEKIDESGFLEPVCQKTVLPNLDQAKSAARKGDWPAVKNALKMATATI